MKRLFNNDSQAFNITKHNSPKIAKSAPVLALSTGLKFEVIWSYPGTESWHIINIPCSTHRHSSRSQKKRDCTRYLENNIKVISKRFVFENVDKAEFL